MVIPASWPDPYYGANPPPGWTIYYGDNFTHRPGHISWQHPVVRPDPRWPIRYGRLSTPAGHKIRPNQVHGLTWDPTHEILQLKDEYHVVMHLKGASGFTWSDETGAGMEKNDPVWKDYVKVVFALSQYENNTYSSYNTGALTCTLF